MPILPVQVADGLIFNNSAPFSPANATFGSNVTAGNFIVAHFMDSYNATVPTSSSYTISDTMGNVWTQLFFYWSFVGGTQQVWYCFAKATGPTTVSVAGGESGAYFNGVEVAQFSGVGLPDQVAIPVWAGPSNPLVSNPITTTQAKELIVSFGSIVSANGFRPGYPHGTPPVSTVVSPMLPLAFSGYENGYDNNDYYYAQMGYQIVSSIQTGYTASQGNPFGNNGTVGVASFFAGITPSIGFVVIPTFFQ
jgi:hypothetical protein